MAYADFTLRSVTRQFNLTIDETINLFGHIAPALLDPFFVQRLQEDVKLALAISTEKARSEFIIAPVLGEVRRMQNPKIALFSGTDLR